MEINLELISSLVKLSRLTTRDIAQTCDISQPNLMAALAGKRTFPSGKFNALLTTLGVDGALPVAGIVHHWYVGVDLQPLQVALQAFFPDGAEIAGLWRQGDKLFNLSRVIDKQLFALYDSRTLVVLQRTGLGTHLPTAKPIGPYTVAGLHWKGGKVGSSTMVSVPSELYIALEAGVAVDEQQMRQLIGCIPDVTWDDVNHYIQHKWHTPQQAMDAIMAINATQSSIKPRPKMGL